MPKFSQTLIIDGNRIECLYNESNLVDVRELGSIKKAVKISDVAFDVRTQEWIAIDRKTQKTIARDKSRAVCVKKEHAYYEKEIQAGRIPWK